MKSILMSDTDDIRKSAPKRTISDIDSELLNINFFQSPGVSLSNLDYNLKKRENRHCLQVLIILII